MDKSKASSRSMSEHHVGCRKVVRYGAEEKLLCIEVPLKDLESAIAAYPNKEVTVVRMTEGVVRGEDTYRSEDIQSVMVYGPEVGGIRAMSQSVGNSGIESIGPSEENSTTEIASSSEGGSAAGDCEAEDSTEEKHSSAPKGNNANMYSESSSIYTSFVAIDAENDMFIIDCKGGVNSTKEMKEIEESIKEMLESLERNDARAYDLHEDIFTHEKIYDDSVTGILIDSDSFQEIYL
jgi:hypothetical protein